MPFTVYILHSIALDKYYVGQTINLAERIELHESKYFKNSFTTKANDWKLVGAFHCDSREEALFIEKQIKQMKSRIYIEKLIKEPGKISVLREKWSLVQSRSTL
jgi:putative endonuclease